MGWRAIQALRASSTSSLLGHLGTDERQDRTGMV